MRTQAATRLRRDHVEMELGERPRNVILGGLPDAEWERLRPYFRPVRLDLREQLVVEGEPIEAMWFPDDAITSTTVDTPEGERIEVGIMGLEGVIGLSLAMGVRRSNTSVFVQVAGGANRIEADDFVEQVVEPKGPLYARVQRYINVFMAMMGQVAACNRLHPVDERLARWLALVRDRTESDTFSLTHDFLAMMLGVRRASVTVSAGILQRAGLISVARGAFTVVNRRGLEEASCSCYSVLKKSYTALLDDMRQPIER